MKTTAYKLNRQFSKELDEAQSELKKWGNWNKRHKYEGAPNPDPKSLAGKIFTFSRGEQPAPLEIRKIARIIWFLGDEALGILWHKYVLNERFFCEQAGRLTTIEYNYMRYKDFWPKDWTQEPPVNDFF